MKVNALWTELTNESGRTRVTRWTEWGNYNVATTKRKIPRVSIINRTAKRQILGADIRKDMGEDPRAGRELPQAREYHAIVYKCTSVSD